MNKAVIIMSLAAACFTLAVPARAVELTYTLEGTITQKTDPSHLVDMVSLGDRVTYTVLVDSEAPNLNSPGLALYTAISGSLQIDADTFECRQPYIWIATASSEGPTSSFEASLPISFGRALAGGYFQLVDLEGTAIPDPQLPAIPYEFTPFEWRSLSITVTNPDVYGDYSHLSGTFDSFSIVPEPATWCLIATLTSLAARKRRPRI